MYKQLIDRLMGNSEHSPTDKRKWSIYIGEGKYVLSPPRRVPQDKYAWYSAWGEVQSHVLSQVLSNWEQSIVNVSVHTFLPKTVEHALKNHLHLTYLGEKEGDYLFVFPELQLPESWDSISGCEGYYPFARMMVAYFHRPDNWKISVTRLFELIQTIRVDMNSSNTYTEQFIDCPFVCYTEYEDMVIWKVDIPDKKMRSIFLDMANEFGLNLQVRTIHSPPEG
jgi:hypothetical protein